MNTATVLCALILISGTCYRVVDSAKSRIYGGTDAQPHEFPFIVSLQRDGQHYCGGSIITNYWILTAAHCVQEPVMVYAGLHVQGQHDQYVQAIPSRRIITHSQYIHDTKYIKPNDIALILLQRPLSWTAAVQPIALPRPYESIQNDLVQIAGWGLVYPETDATTLQKSLMEVTSNDECVSDIPKTVCIQGAYGGPQFPCGGDSGGPMVQNGKLVGIASGGSQFCNIPSPGVYTLVSNFMDFIREYVR